MQIMLTVMLIWILLLVFKLYYFWQMKIDFYIDDIILVIIIPFLFGYIIMSSARINSFFTTQIRQYMKLQSQVFEILCYSSDYLGRAGINSENPFLQLAIKQLRLKTKVVRSVRKIKHVFKIKRYDTNKQLVPFNSNS